MKYLLILTCSFPLATLGTSYAIPMKAISSLNWVEVSRMDLSTQVMFDFTHPIYFKKQINKGKSQLVILFLNIDTQTALKSEIIEKLEELKQTEMISEVSIKPGNKPTQTELAITFAKNRTLQSKSITKTIPNQVLIKWNKIDNPNRLVIDFYNKETLDTIAQKPTHQMVAHNEATRDNSFFFGRKRRPLSRPLRVVLDPGHGGGDSGVIHKETGTSEKDLTLQIAKKVRSLLKNDGVKVLLTRSTDTHVPLVKRSELAEQLKADLFVSLHINATDQLTPTPTATGIETYHQNHDDINKESGFLFYNMAHQPSLTQRLTHFIQNTAHASEQLATSIQTNLLSHLHYNGFQTRDRGVKKGMYRLLIRNSMPSVLAEIGFISEAKLLSNSNYQNCLAKAIFNAIKQN